MTSDPIKALVVDDTVTYRRILTEVLESTGEVAVTATAPQGRLALARMEQDPADLVLLDLEMPEMDGLETLAHLRRRFPETAVVMISGQTSRAAEATLKALEQGALDFVRKPEGLDPEASRSELKDTLRPLIRHVRTRKNLRSGALPAVPTPAREPAPVQAPPPVPPPPARPAALPARIGVVGIGISTGGPNALSEVIPALPGDFPVPILLVQHMPPGFTASLAEHLAKRSRVKVREAVEGEVLEAGTVYIAPGGRHMVVRRRPPSDAVPEAFIVGLNDHPPENSCRPSVDVLFRSMAAQFGGDLLAVVMTGMGNDGCEGVRAMKRRGCFVLTQAEATCVVYGMPAAVDEAGLSDEQVPLHRLAARITELVRRGSRGN